MTGCCHLGIHTILADISVKDNLDILATNSRESRETDHSLAAILLRQAIQPVHRIRIEYPEILYLADLPLGVIGIGGLIYYPRLYRLLTVSERISHRQCQRCAYQLAGRGHIPVVTGIVDGHNPDLKHLLLHTLLTNVCILGGFTSGVIVYPFRTKRTALNYINIISHIFRNDEFPFNTLGDRIPCYSGLHHVGRDLYRCHLGMHRSHNTGIDRHGSRRAAQIAIGGVGLEYIVTLDGLHCHGNSVSRFSLCLGSRHRRRHDCL